MKYNHAYDIGFEVISDREDASDVTPEMIVKAIKARADSILKTGETLEAVGNKFDTFRVPD